MPTDSDSASTIILDTAKQRWILSSIAFAAFMCTLDSSIVYISLPVISKSFHVSIDGVSWVVIVYLLILTSAIPFFGKLGDRIGLIRLFVAGYSVFVSGSFLCGISFSLYMLIFSRFLQALGGAALYALPAAIITRYLPLEKRGYSFGILGTTAAVGFALGGPLGGLITAHFGWQWVFLINVPIGICAILIVLRKFPREKQNLQIRDRFDIPGVFYCFSGLASLMLALNMGIKLGWLSPMIIGLLVSSAVFLILFIRQENNFNYPLLDLKVFRIKNFTYPNLGNFFIFMAANGTNFILPFYLLDTKGIKADKTGLILMAFPVANMIVGPLAGKASDRISPRLLCILGTSLSIAATLFFSFSMHFSGIWPVISFLLITGGSLGLVVPPNNNQIMRAAPKDAPGVASGILRTLTNLGAVMGVALFQIIFSLSFVEKGLQYAIYFAAVLYGLALIVSIITPEKQIQAT